MAAGVTSVASTRRSAQSVLPSQARWLRDSASSVDPARQAVVTRNGDVINYEYIVIAVGLQNDYCKVTSNDGIKLLLTGFRGMTIDAD